MPYDQRLLEQLGARPTIRWQREVFRHMFDEIDPATENVRGAHWNPPKTAAIYMSLTRSVARAEADFHVSLQPLPPSAERRIHRIHVGLVSVVDLSDRASLAALGITKEVLESLDYGPCQQIGGAVEWLGHDGLLVPSARADGLNLVIYPSRHSDEYEFRPIDYEVI